MNNKLLSIVIKAVALFFLEALALGMDPDASSSSGSVTQNSASIASCSSDISNGSSSSSSSSSSPVPVSDLPRRYLAFDNGQSEIILRYDYTIMREPLEEAYRTNPMLEYMARFDALLRNSEFRTLVEAFKKTLSPVLRERILFELRTVFPHAEPDFLENLVDASTVRLSTSTHGLTSSEESTRVLQAFWRNKEDTVDDILLAMFGGRLYDSYLSLPRARSRIQDQINYDLDRLSCIVNVWRSRDASLTLLQAYQGVLKELQERYQIYVLQINNVGTIINRLEQEIASGTQIRLHMGSRDFPSLDPAFVNDIFGASIVREDALRRLYRLQRVFREALSDLQHFSSSLIREISSNPVIAAEQQQIARGALNTIENAIDEWTPRLSLLSSDQLAQRIHLLKVLISIFNTKKSRNELSQKERAWITETLTNLSREQDAIDLPLAVLLRGRFFEYIVPCLRGMHQFLLQHISEVQTTSSSSASSIHVSASALPANMSHSPGDAPVVDPEEGVLVDDGVTIMGINICSPYNNCFSM